MKAHKYWSMEQQLHWLELFIQDIKGKSSTQIL